MTSLRVGTLVDAGLLTSGQASALAPGPEAMAPVQDVIDAGVREDALAGMFVALGYGPALELSALLCGDAHLRRKLPASIARQWLALPVRSTAEGIVVGMVNPADDIAVASIRDVFDQDVIPVVVRFSDGQKAVEAAYGTSDRHSLTTGRTTDRPQLAAPGQPEDAPMQPVTRVFGEPPTEVAAASPAVVRPELSPSAPEDSAAHGRSRVGVSASAVWDAAWERAVRLTEASSTAVGDSAAVPESRRFHFDSISPGIALRADSERPALSHDAVVRDLRASTTRDQAIQLACAAALAAGTSSAFFVCKQGVLRGWWSAGDHVNAESIRSIWLPVNQTSTLGSVFSDGAAYAGMYGRSAADHLLRATLGGAGKALAAAPVRIGSHVGGVLCIADPRDGTASIALLAGALGEALGRLILGRRTDGES